MRKVACEQVSGPMGEGGGRCGGAPRVTMGLPGASACMMGTDGLTWSQNVSRLGFIRVG